MQHKTLIITILSVAALAAGCKPASQTDENTSANNSQSPSSVSQTVKTDATNAWQKTKEATTDAWANVKEGTSNAWVNTKEVTTNAWSNFKEALQPAADYTYDKKDEFVTAAKADLKTMDEKIKALSDKVAQTSGSIKTDAQAKLQALQGERADLGKRLDSVENASQAGWDDAKAAFEKSYHATKNSLKQAWQWLNNKLNS
jgi:hypothetical protein